MAWTNKGSIKGPQGDQGPKGEAATVTVGETTTGEAGTKAVVTNTGDANAAVLNFTVPKGDKGDQGVQGEKGDTGERGPRGAGVSSGSGAPTESGSEVSGDIYIDLATGDVYGWDA